MKRILLNQAGESVDNERNAQYILEVYERQSSSQTEWNNISASVRNMANTTCQGKVSKEFISDNLQEETDIIMILKLSTQNVRTGENRQNAVAFIMINLIEPNTLYIDVLCGSVSERVSQGISMRPGPGKILLNYAELFAKTLGRDTLQLSALPYVIGYYRKMGYRHIQPGAEDTEPSSVTATADDFGKMRFKSDEQFKQAFLIAHAYVLSNGNQEQFIHNLNEYLGNDGENRFEMGDEGIIVTYSDGDINMELSQLANTELSYVHEYIVGLLDAGFNVDGPEKIHSLRQMIGKEDGEYDIPALDEGVTMTKTLKGGRFRKNSSKKYKMSSGKTRRNRKSKAIPWAGWAKLAPKGKQRKTMKKKCGKKCFLGPKESFPICKKNTCKVIDQGLWAAYIRAKEWGKPKSSYKGKAKPRHSRSVYTRAARNAKKMLEKRGYKVGKSATRKKRKSRNKKRRS